MNLSDNEILELNELCSSVVDEALTEKQKSRLSGWILTSLEARQFYIRAMGLSASLFYYASEMHTEEPDAVSSPSKALHRWKWVSVFLALAASVLLVFTLVNRGSRRDVLVSQPPVVSIAAAHVDEFVAQLSGSKQCQWAKGATEIPPGGQLRKGQWIDLEKGFAEITFDCGAQVVLEGPASLEVNSAWSAKLSKGALKASLPPEAMGFSISNPTVEVVDLGTEFTMFADASGAATEVLVLKGEVYASPNSPTDQQSVVLHENESRRFATTGDSGTHADAQKFAELTQLAPLDHFVSPARYAHWSFDQIDGDRFRGEAVGIPQGVADLQLVNLPKAGLGSVLTRGRNGAGPSHTALRFSGGMYARASFPGISDNSRHTVVFWVNVPRDANLANAYAMIAWGVNSRELGLHPIQVGWNRNPSEGTVGALRTDYGGGFAIGATSLRDGRWHHVAVVFLPREDPKAPMDVKQYIDGHFEGEGKPSPPGSEIFAYSAENSRDSDTNGTFWLGCRLGIKTVRTDRFSGALDELFILTPPLSRERSWS